MNAAMTANWDSSAKAWIALMGDGGDYSRRAILDALMMARVAASGAQTVLDVGCGEGRFCRMLAKAGLTPTGLDPTAASLDAARRHGGATFVQAKAEAMPFQDAAFDMVVSYLSLIDIADATTALAEMVRVLRPGGRLLIGNLNAWITAAQIRPPHWRRNPDGSVTATIDRYLEEYAYPAQWQGMDIANWHRPQRFYMQALLGHGMTLTHFDEPEATEAPEAALKNRAPYLYMMEWMKPEQDNA